MTGPGVFSVQSRQTIQTEVERLSLISAGIIITMLLLLYRSPWALALGLVPVLSGALAGVAAVSLGSGVVHGITLGFGITLIGFLRGERCDVYAGRERIVLPSAVTA